MACSILCSDAGRLGRSHLTPEGPEIVSGISSSDAWRAGDSLQLKNAA